MKIKTLLLLCLFLVFWTNLEVSAWVEPKQGEEVPALLNTGSDGQEKKGWLNINNWIKVITNPFSFDVGVESPKFCIKKPDGTTSCCPPQAGQDWSACGGGTGTDLGAKWVWKNNSVPEVGNIGTYELIVTDPKNHQVSISPICYCYENGTKRDILSKFSYYNLDLSVLPNGRSYAYSNGYQFSCLNTCSITLATNNKWYPAYYLYRQSAFDQPSW